MKKKNKTYKVLNDFYDIQNYLEEQRERKKLFLVGVGALGLVFGVLIVIILINLF